MRLILVIILLVILFGGGLGPLAWGPGRFGNGPYWGGGLGFIILIILVCAILGVV